MRDTMKLRLPYLVEDVDRHGVTRVYFRRKGQAKVRIRALPGSKEFSDTYHKLLDGEPTAPSDNLKGRGAIKTGTYRWLCTQYFSSWEFRRLDPRTQRTVRSILEGTLAERVRPERPELFADYPLTLMTAKSIRVLRDRKVGLPGAADKRVKVVRRLFNWAAQNDLVRHNPARDVTLISAVTGGFHSWTPEEVRKFEERHPIGCRARLALALLMFTGARRSDVVLLGRQHVRD